MRSGQDGSSSYLFTCHKNKCFATVTRIEQDISNCIFSACHNNRRFATVARLKQTASSDKSSA
jgi:hypothetical protein